MPAKLSVARGTTRCRQIRFSSNELARAHRWVEAEITFVDHSLFRRSDADSLLAEMRPATLDETSDSAAIKQGIAFVSGMVESRLLTPAEEVYLFTSMNYLKFRAERHRQRLSLNKPDLELVRKIEQDLGEAIAVRNQIVSSNLRLVVALARKLAPTLDQMSELIGEATIPLIRAVELFDVSLGNRFSTYATWAARNQILRRLKRDRQGREKLVAHDHLIHLLEDDRSIPEEDVQSDQRRIETVRQLLTSLSERERRVVVARFGLAGHPCGQSLQQIAVDVGLSKERIRQILIHSLEKLREAKLSESSCGRTVC